MPSTRLLFAFLVACTSVVAAQQPAPFTASTNLIVVPAVVVDRKGATVQGLAQQDFQLFEDGKPVEIQTFVAAVDDPALSEPGRFVVIVLDNLRTPDEIGFRVKSIARRFVEKMGPRDVMSIIPISGAKATTTTSKAELNAAINRFATSAGGQTMTFEQLADHGLRMIHSLSEQIQEAKHPRKVMVFIGDAAMFSPSVPSSSGASGASLSPEWQDAIRATARSNVSVYNIDPRGHEAAAVDWSESFATETGGYAWGRTNNYGAAVDRIWQDSASYYLLGYAPPVNDRRTHKIDVKVSKPGVTIRARKARG